MATAFKSDLILKLPSSPFRTCIRASTTSAGPRAAHTLKFGGEYRWYISPQSFTQRQRGDYDYNSSQLFLEDFSPDNFGERSAGSITYYGNQKAVYWYANDTWKVNTHLTLNLGIRYEYTTISTSEAQQALNTISNHPEHHRAGQGEPAPVVQRAAGSEEQLGSSRRLRLLAGKQRQHLDSWRLRLGLRRALRQHRDPRSASADRRNPRRS